MPVLNEGIDKQGDKVSALQKKWKRIRHAVEGEAAIHMAGETYLPKLKNESTDDYRARRGRTPWYNASWRTMAALVGMLFRKDPVIVHPEGIAEYLKDVTLTGVSFGELLKEIANEVLSVGAVAVLVDHPPRPDTGGRPLTVAMAEQLGLRPSMAVYRVETFIDFKFRRINNKWTLSQFRLMEKVTEPKGEFGETIIDQIRVLDLNEKANNTYRQRLFRKNDNGQWEQYEKDIVPTMNGQPLDRIPLVFVTANGTAVELDDPPLIDLVDMNVKHYQVSADYEHACHFTALPTPWIAGATPDVGPDGKAIPKTYYIGSTKAWTFSDPNAKVGMLEFTGAGIKALLDNLKAKEAQMAAIGARMLAPEKTGVEASDTLAMRHSGENSVLSNVANSLDDAGNKLLSWFAEWYSNAGDTSVRLNKKFLGKALDAATLASYLQAWQQGAISEQELYALLQDGELVREDKSFEDHKGEIESNPPLGVLSAMAAIEAEDDEESDDT